MLEIPCHGSFTILHYIFAYLDLYFWFQVRDSTGARIIFPHNEDADQELITIIGTKEAAAKAKKEIELLVKELVRF